MKYDKTYLRKKFLLQRKKKYLKPEFERIGIKWTNEDELIYKQMSREHKPIILVINKVDTIKDNNLLYEFVSNLTQNRTFS